MNKLLSDIFKEIDGPTLLVEPGGNWGDSLIYVGARHLADKVGLDYTSSSRVDFIEGRAYIPKTVYMHGGGGLTSWGTTDAWDLLKKIVSSPVDHVIIGPSTLVVDKEFVANMFASILIKRQCKKLTFFVRENSSLELMRSINMEDVDLFIDHDTAFHADLSKLLGGDEMEKEVYDLVVVRDDLESSQCVPFEVRKDSVVTDPVNSARSFDHWLRIHANSKSVIGNRTHSIIVSSLMGKDTTMFGGSYHKNASIFEFSLKSRGVKWFPEDKLGNARLRSYWAVRLQCLLPPLLANSYKVKKVITYLYEKANYARGMPRS